MISPVTGAVYIDDGFTFPDNGEVMRKYIVALCDSLLGPEKVIAVRTTSQQKNKNNVIGCHQTVERYPPPNFFAGEVPNIFPIETWLMLDYIAEYDINGFRDRRFRSTEYLPEATTIALLQCVIANVSGRLPNYVVKSASDQLKVFCK